MSPSGPFNTANMSPSAPSSQTPLLIPNTPHCPTCTKTIAVSCIEAKHIVPCQTCHSSYSTKDSGYCPKCTRVPENQSNTAFWNHNAAINWFYRHEGQYLNSQGDYNNTRISSLLAEKDAELKRIARSSNDSMADWRAELIRKGAAVCGRHTVELSKAISTLRNITIWGEDPRLEETVGVVLGALEQTDPVMAGAVEAVRRLKVQLDFGKKSVIRHSGCPYPE